MDTIDLTYRIGQPKLIARASNDLRKKVLRGTGIFLAALGGLLFCGAVASGVNSGLDYLAARRFSNQFQQVYNNSTNEAAYSHTYEDALRIEDQTSKAIRNGNDSRLLRQVNSQAHMLKESVLETRSADDFYIKMADENRANGL